MTPNTPAIPTFNPLQFWLDLQLGTLDAVVSAQQDLGEHFDRVLRAQGAGVEWMSQAWQAWQAWINLGLAPQPLAAPRAD